MVTAVVPARHWGADLVGSHRVAGRAVRGRPAAISAVPGGAVRADGEQDAMRPGFKRNLADPARRILPQRGRPRSIPAVGSRAVDHPVRGQRQHGRAGSRANRPDELSDLVIEGQVLAHERGQHELGDFHELDCLAEHVQWLPTSGCGGEGRRRGGTAPPGLHPATSDGACSGGRETTVRAPRSGAAHLSRASG